MYLSWYGSDATSLLRRTRVVTTNKRIFKSSNGNWSQQQAKGHKLPSYQSSNKLIETYWNSIRSLSKRTFIYIFTILANCQLEFICPIVVVPKQIKFLRLKSIPMLSSFLGWVPLSRMSVDEIDEARRHLQKKLLKIRPKFRWGRSCKKFLIIVTLSWNEVVCGAG